MAVVPMPPKRRPAAPAPAPAPASARTDDALKDQAAALAKPEDAQASAGSAPRPAPALSNRPGRKEEPPSTPSRSGGQGTAADPPDVGVAAAAGRLKGEAETTGRPDGRTVPGRLRPRPDRRLTSDTGGLAPRTRPVVGAAVAAEPVAAADATAARATPAVIVPPAASAAADRSETAKAAAGAGSGRGAKPAPQDPQPSEDETVALTAATQPPDESETAEVPPPRQSLPATATTAVQPSRPRSDRPQPEPENSPRKDRAAASNRPRSDRQTGGAAERQTGGPASRQAEGPDDRQSGEAVFLVDGAQPVLSGFAPLVAGALVTRRYRLLTQLRHTSAVDSWQATDEKLDRLVVVHALADETAADAIIVAARRAATATDARFVRVLDAVADADGLYVITEWAEGTPLAEVLQSGPLTGLEAAWLVKEAAEPLSAVHPLGLFHQRLDATRVLITPTGGVRIAGLVTDAVFNPDPADEAKTR
ncbi:MAG: hypothetical protein LBI84_07445, partial [Propionibacteriaceae bacterium]|nr:hypothetical protein [Propionibacteriaceae bacterium]